MMDEPACATAVKAAAVQGGGNALTSMVSGVFGIGNKHTEAKANRFATKARADAAVKVAELKQVGTIKSAQIGLQAATYTANTQSVMLDKQVAVQRSLMNQSFTSGNHPTGVKSLLFWAL